MSGYGAEKRGQEKCDCEIFHICVPNTNGRGTPMHRFTITDDTTKIAKSPSRTVFFNTMDELDEFWEQMLAEARLSEEITGHLAEFLAVKSANDRLRERGVEQLLNAFEAFAGHANRSHAGIEIEKLESHRFEIDRSHVTGRAIKLRHGLRCLTVEAGWTRTPRDGFMRGNALALARIKHFGIPTGGGELKLLRFEESVRWFRIDRDGLRISVEPDDLIREFRLLLG